MISRYCYFYLLLCVPFVYGIAASDQSKQELIDELDAMTVDSLEDMLRKECKTKKFDTLCVKNVLTARHLRACDANILGTLTVNGHVITGSGAVANTLAFAGGVSGSNDPGVPAAVYLANGSGSGMPLNYPAIMATSNATLGVSVNMNNLTGTMTTTPTTVTVYRNGLATSITITILAGATGFQSFSGPLALAFGDGIDLFVSNDPGAGNALNGQIVMSAVLLLD